MVVAAIVLSSIRSSVTAWNKMGSTLETMLGDRRKCELTRPVLRGTARKGNAWPEYTEILSDVHGLTKFHRLMEDFHSGDPKVDLPQVDVLLERYGLALERLSLGASRSEASYPFQDASYLAYAKRERQMSPAIFDEAWRVPEFVKLAVCKVHILVKRGMLREALNLLLDACQFARDWGTVGWHHGGCSMESIGILMEQLIQIVQLQVIEPKDLLFLDGALEILDQNFPRYDATLLTEVMLSGLAARAVTDSFWGRLTVSAAFEVSIEFASKAAVASRLPWKEEREEAKKLCDVLSSRSKDPLSLNLVRYYSEFGSAYFRHRRALLRLARVAIGYQISNSIPNIGDPFGGMLLAAKDPDGRLKLWSVGRNAIDDKGQGDLSEDGKDIVVQMR